MKNILLLSIALFLASCGGDSDSGAQVDETAPGTMTPESFVGVYTGSLTVTAEASSIAGGITDTDTFPITITVTEDGMIRIDGDDPDETSTTGLADDGTFTGILPIDEDECSGTVVYNGAISNMVASGTLEGEGSCDLGVDIDVELDGTFSASM